jgi:hypothetical protein
MIHDPLCSNRPCKDMPSTLCRCGDCQCDLIAKIREDQIERCIKATRAVPSETTTSGDHWTPIPGTRVQHQIVVALQALLEESA